MRGKYIYPGLIDIYTEYGLVQIEKVKPGQAWEFEHEGKEYKLTLTRVYWVSNSLEASVAELGSKKIKVRQKKFKVRRKTPEEEAESSHNDDN